MRSGLEVSRRGRPKRRTGDPSINLARRRCRGERSRKQSAPLCLCWPAAARLERIQYKYKGLRSGALVWLRRPSAWPASAVRVARRHLLHAQSPARVDRFRRM